MWRIDGNKSSGCVHRSWTHSSLTHHHDPPPPTPPKGPQSASAKKLAELQNKPLPQPPGLVRAMTTSRLGGESEVRQSYFEWSSESEDGSGECVCLLD